MYTQFIRSIYGGETIEKVNLSIILTLNNIIYVKSYYVSRKIFATTNEPIKVADQIDALLKASSDSELFIVFQLF